MYIDAKLNNNWTCHLWIPIFRLRVTMLLKRIFSCYLLYLRSLFYVGQVYYHDNFVMILKFIKTKITVLTEVAASVKTIEVPNKQN